MKTKQEYYDELVCSALDGTFPSVMPDFGCAYRGLNGAKCAAGILIPDDQYDIKMERRSFDEIYKNLGDIIPSDMTFNEVYLIQGWHDNASYYYPFLDKFLGRLKESRIFNGVKKLELQKQ